MKIILTLLFTILFFKSHSQTNKEYYDYAKYQLAYKAYKSSLKEFRNYVKYVDAVRMVEPGMPSLEFNRIDDSLQFVFVGYKSSNRSKVDYNDSFNDSLKKGKIVFVNYTIDTGCITTRYIEMPPYPAFKPIYIEPKPKPLPLVIKTKTIVVNNIKTSEKDTVGVLMMPNGKKYTVDQFTNQYGSKPLRKIFK